MKPNVLVYGWYNQGNIGDELFKEAFRTLFPDYQLVFTSRITPVLLKDTSAVFIGGGSFLYAPLNIAKGALELLKQKKIFYIGVGLETQVHAEHIDLMKQAKLVAIRTPHQLELAVSINPKTVVIPDIVYCLRSLVQKKNKIEKSVLIVPNMAVVPTWEDPHWKHASWDYFKSEFPQFLDYLIDQKYTVKFLAMCQNKKTNDHWAATEIINRLKNRNDSFLLQEEMTDFASITSVFSQYETVITQRFHGIVLSELVRTPYLSIYHHDKLKYSSPGTGIFLSYYETSKRQLTTGFDDVSQKFSDVLPIEDNIFEELRKSVSDLINDG